MMIPTVKTMIALLKDPEQIPADQQEILGRLAGDRTVRITPDLEDLAIDLEKVEITAGFLGRSTLNRMPNLRWAQLWSAGANSLLEDPQVMAADYEITTTAGIHAIPMGEQVMGYLTAFSRGLHRAGRKQAVGVWDDDPWKETSVLHGRAVLILGAGAIGSRVAELCRAFGMRTIGVRRLPTDEQIQDFPIHPVSNLDDLLPRCDIVVNCLPLSRETRLLVDRAAIARMKKGAIFINIGRGQTVDEEALIEALQNGHLSGAGLDVFNEEPLPADSPLWQMENVILTRHYAGSHHNYDCQAMEIFLDNLERFNRGAPLKNRVDRGRGY